MLTETELKTFARIVNAEIVTVTNGNTRLILGGNKSMMSELAITYDTAVDEDATPQIIISSHAGDSMEAGFTVEGSAENAEITQRVDDRNLYTKLTLNSADEQTASVGIHGPPARYEHGSIQLVEDEIDEDQYILN